MIPREVSKGGVVDHYITPFRAFPGLAGFFVFPGVGGRKLPGGRCLIIIGTEGGETASSGAGRGSYSLGVCARRFALAMTHRSAVATLAFAVPEISVSSPRVPACEQSL
jgi:hypothetical protein